MSGQSREFADNSARLFGRENDLAYLLERSEKPGLTAVVARPQMGKTWLLTELARRLSRISKLEVPSLLGRKPCLVGYFSADLADDLLLRAIEDLYRRWLSNSTYWEQAKAWYARQGQKKDFIGKAAEAFGAIVKEVSKLGGDHSGAVGAVAKQVLDGLATANRELNNPLGMPKLPIEVGRELLELVFTVTEQPLILIFDIWEKSRSLQTDANVLESFIEHLSDWPPCHIFLGVLPNEQALKSPNNLKRKHPGKAALYELKEMNLNDSHSRSGLLDFLRERVPGSAAIPDEDLLRAAAGYPGTVAQWTSEYYADKLDSLEDFQRVAKEANGYQFLEFDELLPGLEERLRLLSIRLALLPQAKDSDYWSALKEVVLEGLSSGELEDLKDRKILETDAPPSYGHAKRSEAALEWFIENRPYRIRDISESLIYKLAGHVRDLSLSGVPYVTCLAELAPLSKRLTLDPLAHALCLSGQSLLGNSVRTAGANFETAVSSKKLEPDSAALLAMGLFNTLNDAKQEEALARRDALLQELRNLAATFPNDAAVREQLASGLFNALNHAKQEENPTRRDALLQELRNLAATFPNDAAVREQLAKGLVNVLNHAKQEEALLRRDALLQDLRDLAAAFPDDAAVRNPLASGLFNTLIDTREELYLLRRDALLQELRDLVACFPNDAAVREQLAKGLVNVLNHAKQEEALLRRDAVLQDLRDLAARFPDDVFLAQLMRILDSEEAGARE